MFRSSSSLCRRFSRNVANKSSSSSSPSHHLPVQTSLSRSGFLSSTTNSTNPLVASYGANLQPCRHFYSTETSKHDNTENTSSQEQENAQTQTKPWDASSLRVAIIGSTGDLGGALVEAFAPKVRSVIGVSSGSEFSNLSGRKLPTHLSNVQFVECDITDSSNTFDFLNGVDVVINASNCFVERDFSFKEIFVDGTRNVAFHAKRCGVQRFIHLGALGSFVDSRSTWLNYKYCSEDMAFAAFPDVTIVRPGIMFGDRATTFNHVLNRLAWNPVLLAPHSLVNVQPVWQQDVVDAIQELALEKTHEEVRETVWDLGGPNYYPLADFLKVALRSAGKNRPVVSSTPATLAWEFILGCTQMLPGAKISRDMLVMMKHGWERTHEDGWIVSGHLVEETEKHNTFKDLKVEPRSMEEILPTYFGSSYHREPLKAEKKATV